MRVRASATTSTSGRSAATSRSREGTRLWPIAALLFGSGFCALVYQIAWLREFRLIFGASTAASAAVLAIFIGGLGAGSWLLGRRADRHARPLLFYAQLEAIVAVSAAASPLLLSLSREVYLAAGGTPRLGLVAGTVGRLVLTTLVLAVPTLAMGGTLPAAARGATRREDARRADVAALYAINALGAVVGCVVATFFWLEVLGTRTSLWLAAAINLLVAVAARQVDRSQRGRSSAEPLEREPTHGAYTGVTAPASFLLTAAGVVGFVFFLMELVWYRMLAPLLGGSVFTFGLILAVALAGVGIGGLVYALVNDQKPASLRGFASCCLLEAVAIAATYAMGDWLALLTLALRPLADVGFGRQVAGWTLIAGIVVLPTAVAAGFQFPMLIALFGRGREHLGRHIGIAYATNTVGAIAGALTGGFGLLPWLSAPGAWRFAALMLVVLGASAIAVAWRRGPRWIPVLPLALTALAVGAVTATGPTAVWRHAGIGAGRAHIDLTSANQVREWMHAQRRAIIWEEDGIESTVALANEPAGYSFIVNGKADGSARADAATQVMFGLLGAILNPSARRSLVIGLGTGSSAGWLGAVPGMERVDVVELEPLVVDVARVCDEVNRNALANANVYVSIGDARETLLTARERYDLIVSEPSNPFRAGVASLFTREYYEAARDRLTDRGLFLQWVQMYEIDERTLRTVYATVASVFPHVETWEAGASDLILVGSEGPLAYRAESLATRIQTEPFKAALSATWRTVDLHGFLGHFLANDRFGSYFVGAGVPVNTDDRNIVEFGFARTLGKNGSTMADLRYRARTAGYSRPPSLDRETTIDWEAVETAWVGHQMAEGHFAGVTIDGGAAHVDRQTALVAYYRDTDLPAARKAWQRQTRPPIGPTEMAMVADFEAANGSEAALPIIERLRTYQPGEAAVLLATLRFGQGRLEEAAAALEQAFEDFRAEPWALYQFKERAVALAVAVAVRGPAFAARMFEALERPFAVHALQDTRLSVRASLTRLLPFAKVCRDTFGALEPHVPWTRSILTLRRDCYEKVGDSRADRARRELSEFLSREPRLAGDSNPIH
jgi:spermidine synthase